MSTNMTRQICTGLGKARSWTYAEYSNIIDVVRLTFVAQFWLALRPWSHLRSHGDLGDYVYVLYTSFGMDRSALMIIQYGRHRPDEWRQSCTTFEQPFVEGLELIADRA
jgi:hypothetical protein